MHNVYGSLKEPARNWRVIFKGLTLLDYVIKNGSERVVECVGSVCIACALCWEYYL